MIVETTERALRKQKIQARVVTVAEIPGALGRQPRSVVLLPRTVGIGQFAFSLCVRRALTQLAPQDLSDIALGQFVSKLNVFGPFVGSKIVPTEICNVVF